MKPSRIAAVAFALLGGALVACIGWIAIPAASAAEPQAAAAFTVDYDPLDNPLVRAEITELLLEGYDPASETYQYLVDHLVEDGMQMIVAVDAARYERQQWRQIQIANGQPVSSPSPLWLLIPGGLMVFGGAYLRRRHQQQHNNTTPPSMARKGR